MPREDASEAEVADEAVEKEGSAEEPAEKEQDQEKLKDRPPGATASGPCAVHQCDYKRKVCGRAGLLGKRACKAREAGEGLYCVCCEGAGLCSGCPHVSGYTKVEIGAV